MDIINLLINREEIKTVCCLCFKHDDNAMDIFKDVQIQDENRTIILTVFSMLKFLFPSQDILFNQACADCANLIITMYLTLNRHAKKVTLFTFILNNLERDIEKKILLLSQKDFESCRIYINTMTKNKDRTRSEPLKEDITYSYFVNCEKCDMKFKSKEILQQHTKISHCNPNGAIVCDICGKIFKTPHSLKAHYNCHSEKSCPYCHKNLKSHSHYRLHLKNHINKTRRIRKKKYRCNDCDYKSIDKASLEAHLNKIHLNMRPYTCEVCFKGYFKKKTLTEHVKTHEVIRNVTCEVCGESFVHKKSLLDHLRLHTGEKPYECEVCKVRFVTNGRRWEHMKRKHMEKTESCLICDKKYSMKSELKRHMEKVHGSHG